MVEERHSIRIDLEKCVGCVICMKACPTKAIQYSDTNQLTDTINKWKPISILKVYRENIEC